MSLLIKNIKALLQIREGGELMVSGKAMAELPQLNNAWLLTDGDIILDYGAMDSFDKSIP